MPEEPVKTDPKKKIEREAYLVEARSIGGLSGSPVFVKGSGVVPPSLQRERSPLEYIAPPWREYFWLLGLMHGHWDVGAADIDAVALDNVQAGSINTGIGIVVPAQKILEVISQPKLETMRQEIEDKRSDEISATPDSLSEPESEGRPFTHEDFEEALKTVSSSKSDAETT